MQKILDAFQQFFSFLETLVKFVVNFIESIIQFLGMLPSCISMLMDSIAYLPSHVMVFATISITVSVIFIIVGRGRTN